MRVALERFRDAFLEEGSSEQDPAGPGGIHSEGEWVRGDSPDGVPRIPGEVQIRYWDGFKRRSMASVVGVGKEV